jgi:hypothetical protein
MPHPDPKMNLPKIDQVVDLPHDPVFPLGFRSSPDNDTGQCKLDGIESVRAFALSYRWDTASMRRSAIVWARFTPIGWLLAETLRQSWATALNDVQKKNINYGCNFADDIPGGSQTYVEIAFDTRTNPPTAISGGCFPANFAEGSGDTGQTTSEKSSADAKALAFAALISDVRKGAVAGSAGAVA